jgi:hypothetical protein
MSSTLLKKVIVPNVSIYKVVGAWGSLSIGLLLLLIAVFAWQFLVQVILPQPDKEDVLASYIVLAKPISGKQASQGFDTEEMEELSKLNTVQKVAPIIRNTCKLSANIGGSLGFYTELFIEAVDEKMIEKVEGDFTWSKGQNTLPIIVSNEYLNTYNYGFALSQGLPQLTNNTIKNVPIKLSINDGIANYYCKVVGFTDRIGSVLAPKEFVEYINQQFGVSVVTPARLMLKVKDPSDAELLEFVKQHNYVSSEQIIRLDRIRTIVQIFLLVIAGIAITMLAVSMLSFLLFVEVTMQRAKHHLQLLMQIGYHPKVLIRTVSKYYVKWLLAAFLIAALILTGIYWGMKLYFAKSEIAVPSQILFYTLVVHVIVCCTLLLLLFRKASGLPKEVNA